MTTSRHLRRLFVDCLVAFVASTLIVTVTSSGHASSAWYPNLWETGERNQDYGFEDEFPSGAWRDRVEDGAKDWNALDGNMQFHKGGVNVTWNYAAPCSNLRLGDNGVHWQLMDGPGDDLAERSFCLKNNGALKAIQIQFDKQEPWYTGTSNPPNDKMDAWSVATHEWGHAGGFVGHWAEGSDLCTVDPRHTMCGSIASGESYQRDPTEHDRHTFNSTY